MHTKNSLALPAKVHVGTTARQLTEPYTGTEVANVDDFGLRVFLCQGSISWHRHIDEDEMFLVYTGVMTIDSEIGPVFLRSGELTVVPKGVRHRSSSLIRAEVLIFQARMLADQHNGHRRLYALSEEGNLAKTNIYTTAMDITKPFLPHLLTEVGDFAVNLLVCEGTSERKINYEWATLLLIQQGEVTVHTDLGEIELRVGDAQVIPRGVAFFISAQKRSLLLEFSREVTG